LVDYIHYRKPLRSLRAWTDELAFIAEQKDCPERRREAIRQLVHAMYSANAREYEIREAADSLRRHIEFNAFEQRLEARGDNFQDFVARLGEAARLSRELGGLPL
jgi:hypothetical protein